MRCGSCNTGYLPDQVRIEERRLQNEGCSLCRPTDWAARDDRVAIQFFTELVQEDQGALPSTIVVQNFDYFSFLLLQLISAPRLDRVFYILAGYLGYDSCEPWHALLGHLPLPEDAI